MAHPARESAGALDTRTFPFTYQAGVNRKQVRGFADLEFIAKAENIVFAGKTGVGNTPLMAAQRCQTPPDQP